MADTDSRIRTWRIASTEAQDKPYADSHNEADTTLPASSNPPKREEPMSCITETQLSPDGSCIITSDHSRNFSVYPMASALPSQGAGSESEEQYQSTPQRLTPYSQFHSADPIWSFALNPHFNFTSSTTTTALVSRRDQYISLHNILWDLSPPSSSPTTPPPTSPINISIPLTTYALISPLTEALLTPSALAFSPCAHYFYAAHRNAIAIFDTSHTTAPITNIRTIPSARSTLKGGGYGFKGELTALAVRTDGGVIAAGARTRVVGVYDAVGGREVTHFRLPGAASSAGGATKAETQLRTGKGITHLRYSPCSRYLVIGERASSGLLIYDARNFGLALGWCAGRDALSNQRMAFDVWTPPPSSSSSGYGYGSGDGAAGGGAASEVWAGDVRGNMHMWREPWLREGAVQPDETIRVGGDDDAVSGVCVAPGGDAVVVASGGREVAEASSGWDGGGGGNGGGGESRGKYWGGLTAPRYREWGRLEVLGLRG